MNTLLAASIVGVAQLAGQAALGRILEVGPTKAYVLPSAAIAAARDGDTIEIQPATYFDCAIVPQSNLTIQGTGPNVVITDKICQGKAILVVSGTNVTIRNLTLQRARAPDDNGAGIRAEGGNLTVETTSFINNENGILSADNPRATLRIVDSTFLQNGACKSSCAHAVYANHIGLLHIEHSVFRDTRVGHHIKSRAQRTEVIGNQIEDGPNGTSSYLIDIPNGGNLLVEGNRMQKGPHTSNPANAIVIGAEGVTQPTTELVIRQNRFTNDQDRGTTFVHNITATPAQMTANVFVGQVRPLVGDGSPQ